MAETFVTNWNEGLTEADVQDIARESESGGALRGEEEAVGQSETQDTDAGYKTRSHGDGVPRMLNLASCIPYLGIVPEGQVATTSALHCCPVSGRAAPDSDWCGRATAVMAWCCSGCWPTSSSASTKRHAHIDLLAVTQDSQGHFLPHLRRQLQIRDQVVERLDLLAVDGHDHITAVIVWLPLAVVVLVPPCRPPLAAGAAGGDGANQRAALAGIEVHGLGYGWGQLVPLMPRYGCSYVPALISAARPCHDLRRDGKADTGARARGRLDADVTPITLRQCPAGHRRSCRMMDASVWIMLGIW